MLTHTIVHISIAVDRDLSNKEIDDVVAAIKADIARREDTAIVRMERVTTLYGG